MASVFGDTVNLKTIHSFLARNETSTSSGSTVVSYSHDLGKGPVLWLVHGYPQSAYIFRHLIPLLKDKISLFVPELPGYGVSSPSKDPSRSAIGAALLEASHSIFPKRDLILGGHDRGARLSHRLAVAHAHPSKETAKLHDFELLAVILLDIVPTLTQWQVFRDPNASAAYFHWSFLASPNAADMIEAYGGDKWCHDQMSRTAGPSPSAVEACQTDDSWRVYQSLHTKRETIEGSCADYTAAVSPEPQDQEAEQKAGKKIEVPTLVMWSLARLGKMHGDVGGIWRDWVKDGVDLTARGVGNGVGHYLPEEASEEVGKAIIEIVDRVLSSP